MVELTNIQKRFNRSYIESQKLLKEIYESEYKFQSAENNNIRQKNSNSAHDAKDKLNSELEKIMSLSQRGRITNSTRKRRLTNNNRNPFVN
jgi:hypothetical protein